MDFNEQRDYAEEEYNRGIQEREGREEYCNKEECPRPTWVSGMMYVSDEDVLSVYEELKANGRESQLIDESCGRQYHPAFSFDLYAF